ncbi:thiamine-phosphate kinase [Thiococcus pfennigii]|uniref:thiamine-phosphate kinase n=1 Tax=Thiococcus pfennigii TaxID=1057 RepID=UPI001904C870|nr:thiamine-phosphate kinase [Thiococcus pfennigii]
MSERDLIRDYFAALGARRADVLCGIGDDCALLAVPPDRQLAISIDTLVAGVHFFADCNPQALGHKSLAVGLSDLAAMGAEPAWATLALTLPESDPDWLAGFARGLGELATAHGVQLVGGDTTRGPLTVSIQVHGLVAPGLAVTRAGARPGDLVCVSGTVGDAGLALRQLAAGEAPSATLRRRLERPEPRVALGRRLAGLASAMIDCSDGLAGDLGHILAASGVGADLELAALPLGPEVAAVVAASGDWGLPLASGDDYELCFTIPAARRTELEARSTPDCPVTLIGQITAAPGLRCRGPDGDLWPLARSGYDHFAP